MENEIMSSVMLLVGFGLGGVGLTVFIKVLYTLCSFLADSDKEYSITDNKW